MNTQNIDYAIAGDFAKHFLMEEDMSGNVSEQMLRDMGLQEQDVPKERIQEIKQYADFLKGQGKNQRNIRRAVARKFNIKVIA